MKRNNIFIYAFFAIFFIAQVLIRKNPENTQTTYIDPAICTMQNMIQVSNAQNEIVNQKMQILIKKNQSLKNQLSKYTKTGKLIVQIVSNK